MIDRRPSRGSVIDTGNRDAREKGDPPGVAGAGDPGRGALPPHRANRTARWEGPQAGRARDTRDRGVRQQ